MQHVIAGQWNKSTGLVCTKDLEEIYAYLKQNMEHMLKACIILAGYPPNTNRTLRGRNHRQCNLLTALA
jgi:hypothetical protein